MRLVMTLLVRNEEDILRENLDFHFSRGVDFVIATDNLSQDSTPDILREYEKEGRLLMIREEQDDYSQDIWVTRMARLAASQYDADWIINNDADEFWWPLQGDLKEVLGGYGMETGVVLCPRRNFVCRPDHGARPFWDVMVYRQSVAVNELGNSLPPKACHRAALDVVVGQGNHRAANVEGRYVEATRIEILHFPIRSWEQFFIKVKYGGAAYGRNTRLPPTAGKRWRLQYGMLQQGTLSDYFLNLVCTDNQLEAGLREGSIVEDLRLRQCLKEIGMNPSGGRQLILS
jgi:hypothetical protein